MPRENRKRGKKHKKPQDSEHLEPFQTPHEEEIIRGVDERPSWIVENTTQEDVNPEAPFGYVDVDVKAYFRTVDAQMRQWHDASRGDEDGTEQLEQDQTEEKRMFFLAALSEMAAKEKQLATDPDCSVILERMSHSMDDFVRRVLVDTLSGSYEALAKHRFASHVCQTLFTVAADTVDRETRGTFPPIPESSDAGELRTMTQLILDLCEELLPSTSSLIMDPFASHVLRALLLLLSPGSSSDSDATSSSLRSKKSANWKARQGSMKSVFADGKGKGKEPCQRRVPPSFQAISCRFVETLRAGLGENEVRALAANKVASPGLQIFLQIEAENQMSDQPGSLLDHVTVGIVSASHTASVSNIELSDYLNTLLRDPTSSHLLETIVTRAPAATFAPLWRTYFEGKIARLATHPVANFVVAKGLERLECDQLHTVISELENVVEKLIKTSRTGVLRALVDRAVNLSTAQSEVVDILCSSLDLKTSEDRLLLAPCLLYLSPLKEYKTAREARPPTNSAEHRGGKPVESSLKPSIQGALILQSLLHLSEPPIKTVIDSLLSIEIADRIMMSHDPVSSRVFDVLLEAPSVPSKSKRQFVMDLIGHYHELVDDRIGSRVGDRCWAFADTYLKEKIARSLIKKENDLAGSFFGKFFARNLNLYLLQRRPEEWRNLQSDKKRALDTPREVQPPQPPPIETKSPTRRKRHHDEIEQVFSGNLGKRIKTASLEPHRLVTSTPANPKVTMAQDAPLQAIFGAIREAPSDIKHHKKRTSRR